MGIHFIPPLLTKVAQTKQHTAPWRIMSVLEHVSNPPPEKHVCCGYHKKLLSQPSMELKIMFMLFGAQAYGQWICFFYYR